MTTNASVDVRRRGHLFTVGGSENWCRHDENYYAVPPNAKNSFTTWSSYITVLVTFLLLWSNAITKALIKESFQLGFQFQGIRIHKDRVKAWQPEELRAWNLQPEASGKEWTEGDLRFLNLKLSASDTHLPKRPHILTFFQTGTKDQVVKCPRIMSDISSKWAQPLLLDRLHAVQKYTSSFMLISTLCSKARKWNQPRCLITHEWILKLLYTYTMERCSTAKKNETCREKKGWSWK